MKKVGDRITQVPLTMSDLTEQRNADTSKALKDNEDPSTQVKVAEHTTK